MDTTGSGGSTSSGFEADGPFTQPETGDSSDDRATRGRHGVRSTGDTDDPSRSTGQQPAGDDNQLEVDPADDTLPNTGAEPVSWLVVAYSLIAIGGGLVVTGRLFHPAFAREPKLPRRYQPRHSKRARHSNR